MGNYHGKSSFDTFSHPRTSCSSLLAFRIIDQLIFTGAHASIGFFMELGLASRCWSSIPPPLATADMIDRPSVHRYEIEDYDARCGCHYHRIQHQFVDFSVAYRVVLIRSFLNRGLRRSTLLELNFSRMECSQISNTFRPLYPRSLPRRRQRCPLARSLGK